MKTLKPKNLVAKDLRTPKYRMRVVSSKVGFNRNQEKKVVRKEVSYYGRIIGDF